MSVLAIRYYGDMTGCVRPRVTRRGHFYYTKEQREFRQNVRKSLEGLDTTVLEDGPLRAEMHVYYPAPKRQKEELALKHTRPDCDNIIKVVFDSLFYIPRTKWDKGLPEPIMIDDSRVAELKLTKSSTHDDDLLGFSLKLENI